MTRPIPHRALYEEVAERLRQLIYSGELAPGTWIDERALVERFGTSRTPLREALKVLHAEGLVRPGRAHAAGPRRDLPAHGAARGAVRPRGGPQGGTRRRTAARCAPRAA